MRQVVLGAALAACLVTALTGCSARGSVDEPSSSGAPASSTTATNPLPLLQDTKGLTRLRWVDTGSVIDGAPVLSINNARCVTPSGITVQETSTTVTVTAWGAKHPEPCTAIGYAISGPLTLRSPLGDRALRHGH